MARYHTVGYVHGVDRNKVVVPSGITVQVFNPGGSTGVSFNTWNAAAAGSSQGANLTMAGNKFEFWTDAAQAFDLVVGATGHNTVRVMRDNGGHQGGELVSGGVAAKPINVNLTTAGGAPPEYGLTD